MERLALHVRQAIWVTLPHPTEKSPLQQLIAAGRQLGDTVRTVRSAGALPLVLGGDCLLTSLGAVAGIHQNGEQPGIVWFDAHGDFNTPETSPSGLLAGMPLAILAGRGELALAKEIGVQAAIPEWHILLAGVRSLDPGESAALENSALTRWSAQDLRLAGASELGREMGDWPPVYLHVDLDVLDPSLMPAVTYPEPGGLALETLQAAIEVIAASAQIAALSITSFNPQRDEHDLGLATGVQVIEAAVRTIAI